MSIKRMTGVWDCSKMEGSKRLVMLCLADFANDNGLCWPSYPTIAKKCLISDRQVIRNIQECVDAGELLLISRRGRHKTNIYIILAGNQVESAVEAGREASNLFDVEDRKHDILTCFGFEVEKHDIPDEKHDTGGKENMTPASPDPSIDPSPDPGTAKPRQQPDFALQRRILSNVYSEEKVDGRPDLSPLAGYIDQEMGLRSRPMPNGQRNQLASTFTTFTRKGPVKHPSPDSLWAALEAFRTFVEQRVNFWKNQGGDSPAIRRRKLVSNICNYTHAYGWFAFKEKEGTDAKRWKDI